MDHCRQNLADLASLFFKLTETWLKLKVIREKGFKAALEIKKRKESRKVRPVGVAKTESSSIVTRLLLGGIAFLMAACASGHHPPFEEPVSPVRDPSVLEKHIRTAVSASSCLSITGFYVYQYGLAEKNVCEQVVAAVETPTSLLIADRLFRPSITGFNSRK
jgi:hypothetical protein